MEKHVSAVEFYTSNGFGLVSEHLVERISTWIDATNEEMVINAMKYAISKRVYHWGFVEHVLMHWKKTKSS